MNKAKRTGAVVAGTAAVVGMTLGVAPVTAYAADTGESMPVQTEFETSMLASPEAAEDTSSYAPQAVEDAAKEVTTAREEADQAFNDAKSDAESADKAASREVEDAERSAAEAKSTVCTAEENAAAADMAAKEAEENANKVVEENNVTESDIKNKEAALDDANTALDKAAEDASSAKTATEEAKRDVESKEATKESAKASVDSAKAAVREATEAVNSATERAEQADEDLRTAEGLKDGNIDITETEQYKTEQQAKLEMDAAEKESGDAAEKVTRAEEALADADNAAETAHQARDAATKLVAEKEASLAAAEKEKEEAANAKAEAQSTYEAASEAVDGAAAVVTDAETSVTDAKAVHGAAEQTSKELEDAVNAARDAVDTARQEAEEAVDAAIAGAEKTAAEKKAETEDAYGAVAAAEEKYKQGTLGLIDWMLEKDGLTKDQLQDLQFARDVLVNAAKEDFSHWFGGTDTGLPEERGGKVVVIGDEYDATNLENLLRSIEIMKKINELHATDDNYTGDLQRSDAYTNFFFMATAEAGAMRGAGLMRHTSLTTSCENLAFGYSDPTVGWYNKEKAVFDRIKGELGISRITSMDDVSKIEEEANRQKVVVGHYTNLMWAADQVMGVGYTQYGKRYGSTSCYNASKASNYTDDRYNRAMHLYAIEDFEELVKAYYATADKKACEDVYQQAASAQKEAENHLNALVDGKEAAIEAAVQQAQATLAEKEAEAANAQSALSAARQALGEAEAELQSAIEKKAAADQAMSDAEELLAKAKGACSMSDAAYVEAEKAYAEARESAAGAEDAYKAAMAAKEAARVSLEEKRGALLEAEKNYETAAAVHDEAMERLTALTSDDTLEALREKKQSAEAILRSAVDDKTEKESVLRVAEQSLLEAIMAVNEAKADLAAAEKHLAETMLAKDSVQMTVDQVAGELKQMRGTYELVLQAISARDAAKVESEHASEALEAAKEGLLKAQEGLEQALQTKEATADKLLRAMKLSVEDALVTPIEDEDFAYLNTYIDAIKRAEVALQAAKEQLDASGTGVGVNDANDKKTASKAEPRNSRAQREYLISTIDAAIAQSSDGTYRIEIDPVQYPAQTNEVVYDSVGETQNKASAEIAQPATPKTGYSLQESTADPNEQKENNGLLALLLTAFVGTGGGVFAAGFKKRKTENTKASK